MQQWLSRQHLAEAVTAQSQTDVSSSGFKRGFGGLLAAFRFIKNGARYLRQRHLSQALNHKLISPPPYCEPLASPSFGFLDVGNGMVRSSDVKMPLCVHFNCFYFCMHRLFCLRHVSNICNASSYRPYDLAVLAVFYSNFRRQVAVKRSKNMSKRVVVPPERLQNRSIAAHYDVPTALPLINAGRDAGNALANAH